MKNKFILSIIVLFFFQKFALGQEFNFEVNEIELSDKGNLITTNKGKAYSNDKNLEISSDKFEYIKLKKILKSSGNGLVKIKSRNLQIKYDYAVFDQNNLTISASGNVEITQTNKDLVIKNNNIFFDQNKNVIKSNEATKIEDKLGNVYYVDNFEFKINEDLIKVQNLISKDVKNNTIKTSLAFINTKTGNVFGKDVDLNLNNAVSENDFRLKGNSIVIDNKKSEIKKGVFTSCKKRDECPPWQFSAEKITHDTQKREISYDKATLRVYDLPVAYFPKFFHPDPTVKRRTGFLIPAIKNSSNFGNYLNTPFFFALADNKDFTVSPRFYTDEQILLQTEYRQKNKRTDHITDFSLFAKKDGSTKSHFFYKLDKNLIVKKFDYGDFNLKLQKVSNDTYLKSNKLKSNLVGDNNILENSINFDFFSNDLSVNLNSTIYEDLDKPKSDRFEYILPKLEIVKNFNDLSLLNGNFSFKSTSLIRNYDANVYEKNNINDLTFRSNSKINKYGINNNYEFLLKNSNSENKNSNYKNKKNFFLSGIYQFNSSLPLMKENDSYQKILKPKISFKVAPGHTKNDRDVERKIDLNNIYSLTRTSDDKSIEGGLSTTYGLDYSIIDKSENNEILSLKLANNLRLENNDNLSNTNHIGEKMSDIFSEVKYSPNNFFMTKYSSSIKNNLNDITYENLVTEFKINNFVTTFEYLNENNTSSKTSFLSNKTDLNIDEANSFSFATRQNKTKDLTEYYKFMYQYKNDCLAASIEYDKDFYSDRDVKPDESILFKLTIIPFAETSSPNLKQ